MTHLLSDARVVEAARRALYKHAQERWGWGSDEYDSVIHGAEATLSAAVAALPREELVEKAARAIAARGGWYGDDGGWYGDDPGGYLVDAEAVLVAVGLIPEHVTATEEPK